MNRRLLIPLLLLLGVFAWVFPAFAFDDPTEVALSGKSWRATTIGGNPVQGRPPTLTINGDKVSGSGGCNRYFAAVDLGKEHSIRFGAIGSTRMACEGVEGDQEAAFFKALSSATSYHLNNDYLVLLDAKFNKLVEFSADPKR